MEDSGPYTGQAMITTPLPAKPPTSWPATITEVAKAFPGVCERTLRRKVRELNCCSIVGNKIYLTAQDFETLIDSTRPRPKEPRGGRLSSIAAGLLGPNSYEKALALATQKSLKSKGRTVKRPPVGKGRR